MTWAQAECVRVLYADAPGRPPFLIGLRSWLRLVGVAVRGHLQWVGPKRGLPFRSLDMSAEIDLVNTVRPVDDAADRIVFRKGYDLTLLSGRMTLRRHRGEWASVVSQAFRLAPLSLKLVLFVSGTRAGVSCEGTYRSA